MRLIDADALLDEVMNRHCNDCDRRKGIKNGKYRIIYSIGDAPCRACEVDDFKDQIEDAPTIEPEIVRCKDCKHWKRQTAYNGNPLSFGFCESDYMWRSLYGETYEVSHIDTDDDFYCGYAERKDT